MTEQTAEAQYAEVNAWLDSLDADKMPQAMSPASFAYLIYRLSRAYEITPGVFMECSGTVLYNLTSNEIRASLN